MRQTNPELVRTWLIKALHDLKTAQALCTDQLQYLDTAIFHCQQSAEKAVKGFLVFHQKRFEKTHNIESLIDLAAPIEGQFAAWREHAARLTPPQPTDTKEDSTHATP